MRSEYKTEWDLSHIYKKNPEKESSKDCRYLEKIYNAFTKKYGRKKEYTKSPRALAKAIEDYEKLVKDRRIERPHLYYTYKIVLNSGDDKSRAKLLKLSEFQTDLSNRIIFFILDIGQIPKKVQKKFLKSKELQEFRYFLYRIFKNAEHQLTEAEEKIMNLKSLPAHGLWVSGSSKLRSKQIVEFEGKTIPITEASAMIATLPKTKRHKLYENVTNTLKKISDFAESEINSIVINKKINDKLRGFKLPYESTILSYENEIKTLDSLLEAVNKNMGIAHRFYKIKAKMLSEQKLLYADRSISVGNIKFKIPIKDGVRKIILAFNQADKEFGSFVSDSFKNGLVDVFPKKGKGEGASCSTGTGLPSYILLNHINDFRSLTTLAHEMGHAIHGKYSRSQRPLYEGHTTSTAEVASTFFENLVFDQELSDAEDREKMILLHNKISDDISTIFRQIACFNFELELHNTIRKEGFLPKERIAELMNKHMKSYLGPVFKLVPDDGYTFVSWSHIRRFFYVYSYAFGQLISSTLYEQYRKDRAQIKNVIKFLSAGRSDSPENIFKSIGIKLNKKFFETGLQRIRQNINELERLWKKSKTKR